MPASRFRIVSLVPSLTELCFDMGLEESLAGRTDFCISPPGRVEAIPSVGGPKSVDAARLSGARPSHVLVSPEENNRDVLGQIANAGAEAVIVHPLTPADNRALYLRFGDLFDRREEAALLAARLDAACGRAARCRARTPLLSALPLVWTDPWVTVGCDTYVAAMLDAVGLRVAPPGGGLYPRVADLRRAAAAVDWVLLTSEPYPFSEADVAALRTDLDRSAVALISGEAVAWYGSRAISGLDELIALKYRLLDNPGAPPHMPSDNVGDP